MRKTKKQKKKMRRNTIPLTTMMHGQNSESAK